MNALLAPCVLSLGLLAGAAQAQLVPERLYYGKDRAMPMSIESEGDDLVVRLHTRDGELKGEAPVVEGEIDLAAVFPELWKAEQPVVLYAQLYSGDKGVGSPVVLQPLVSRDYATGSARNPETGRPMIQWARAQGFGFTYSGMRAYEDRHVIFDTSHGEIEFTLRPDHAPNTAWNFLHLVEGGFYTDIIFHRIIGRGSGFVIQAGDPTGTGTGGPGYNFDLEDSKLPHDFGVLSTARSNDPNSNGSQFFVCLSRDGTHFLDGLYTSYGQTVRGGEAVVAMGAVETDSGDRPNDPPVINRAWTIPAPPFGEGREPQAKPDAGR